MSLARRGLLTAALASPFILPPRAHASQPLRLLVGAAAGSAGDRNARAFAPFLERHLPHSRLEVRNIAADGGLGAYRTLASAEADGTIVGFVATPALPARMLDRGGGTLMAQLHLLGAVHREPIVIVSPTASPLTTQEDIIRRTSTQGVPLATPAPGSAPHLTALRFQASTGQRLNLIAFPSSAAARQAIVAGHAAAAILSLSEALDPLREGKLTGLALGVPTPAAPDFPALPDLGANLSAFIRRGLAVPASTPEDRAQRLITAMQSVLADPEFTAQANETGSQPVWTPGPVWTTLANAEHAELARLWQAAPWLPGKTG